MRAIEVVLTKIHWAVAVLSALLVATVAWGQSVAIESPAHAMLSFEERVSVRAVGSPNTLLLLLVSEPTSRFAGKSPLCRCAPTGGTIAVGHTASAVTRYSR